MTTGSPQVPAENASPPRTGVLTGEEIADLVRPFAISRGRSFLVYDEAKRVQDAGTDVPLIQKASDLLGAFYAAQPNLSFVRSHTESGMNIIATEFSKKWQLNNKNLVKDWVETMTRRIQNINRVVSQATRAGSRYPKWAELLPWVNKVEELGKMSGAAPVRVAPNIEHAYGFDSIQKVGTRWDKKKPKSYREASLPLEDDVSKLGSEFVKAVWEDGDMIALSVYTYDDLREDLGMVKQAAKCYYWEGEHSVTHHKLYVKRRIDRAPYRLLATLWEQEKQVKCANAFGQTELTRRMFVSSLSCFLFRVSCVCLIVGAHVRFAWFLSRCSP